MTQKEYNAANNSTGVHPTGVIRSNLEIHPLTLNHATSCATSFTVFDNTRQHAISRSCFTRTPRLRCDSILDAFAAEGKCKIRRNNLSNLYLSINSYCSLILLLYHV